MEMGCQNIWDLHLSIMIKSIIFWYLNFNPFQTAYGEDFLKKMGIPPDSSARNSILDHVKHVLSYTIQFLLWYTF